MILFATYNCDQIMVMRVLRVLFSMSNLRSKIVVIVKFLSCK